MRRCARRGCAPDRHDRGRGGHEDPRASICARSRTRNGTCSRAPRSSRRFLRTYAEYLGLDARLLVEEYRQRYERPATQELTPFSAVARASGAGGGAGRRARAGRWSSVGGRRRCCWACCGCSATIGQDDETPAPPEPGPADADADAGEEEVEVGLPRAPRARARSGCGSSPRGRSTSASSTATASRSSTSRPWRPGRATSRVRAAVPDELRQRQRADARRRQAYAVAACADPIGYDMRPGRDPRRLLEPRGRTCRRERPRRHRRHRHRGAHGHHPDRTARGCRSGCAGSGVELAHVDRRRRPAGRPARGAATSSPPRGWT